MTILFVRTKNLLRFGGQKLPGSRVGRVGNVSLGVTEVCFTKRHFIFAGVGGDVVGMWMYVGPMVTVIVGFQQDDFLLQMSEAFAQRRGESGRVSG